MDSSGPSKASRSRAPHHPAQAGHRPAPRAAGTGDGLRGDQLPPARRRRRKARPGNMQFQTSALPSALPLTCSVVVTVSLTLSAACPVCGSVLGTQARSHRTPAPSPEARGGTRTPFAPVELASQDAFSKTGKRNAWCSCCP